MLTKEEMPACPVATTVQLIGSKWKLPDTEESPDAPVALQ